MVWLASSSKHCHQAWPDSAFGGCRGHGLECLGFLGCCVGLVVVSIVRTSEFWSHLMSLCSAVLPLVRVPASLESVRMLAAFVSVLWCGIVTRAVNFILAEDIQQKLKLSS
jgi:hypothetical protein